MSLQEKQKLQKLPPRISRIIKYSHKNQKVKGLNRKVDPIEGKKTKTKKEIGEITQYLTQKIIEMRN